MGASWYPMKVCMPSGGLLYAAAVTKPRPKPSLAPGTAVKISMLAYGSGTIVSGMAAIKAP